MQEGIAYRLHITSTQDRFLTNISSCGVTFNMVDSSISHSNGTASMLEPAQDDFQYGCDKCGQVG